MRAQRYVAALSVTLLAVLGVLATGLTSSASAEGRTFVTYESNFEVAPYRWTGTREVRVYNHWSMPACSASPQTAGNPSTPPVSVENANRLLRESIAEINNALGGALVLVDAGEAPAAELCGLTNPGTYHIVVGFGALPFPAVGRTQTRASIGASDGLIIGARVILNSNVAFTCPSEPVHRDLRATISHELLHAIGIDHTTDSTALMFPTAEPCRSPYTLQLDDINAVHAQYPPLVPLPPTPPAGPAAPAPVAKIGLAVTAGGGGASTIVTALASSACSVESISVLISGSWLTYIDGAPAVVNARFPAALATGTPYFYRCR